MKNKMVKCIAVATGICCIAAVGIGSSMAYFTDTRQVVNKFSTGAPEVDLQESDWDPHEGDGADMYPGYSVYKNPTIRNVTSDKDGPQPVYVRMTVYIKDSTGALITDKEALSLIKTTIRYDSTYTGTYSTKGEGEVIIQGRIPGYSLSMLENIPMTNPVFEYDEERSTENTLVYNYMGPSGNGILDIGEEAALFTAIVIPMDWTQEEMERCGAFTLDIAQESIQTAGFASQQAAFEALDVLAGVSAG